MGHGGGIIMYTNNLKCHQVWNFGLSYTSSAGPRRQQRNQLSLLFFYILAAAAAVASVGLFYRGNYARSNNTER